MIQISYSLRYLQAFFFSNRHIRSFRRFGGRRETEWLVTVSRSLKQKLGQLGGLPERRGEALRELYTPCLQPTTASAFALGLQRSGYRLMQTAFSPEPSGQVPLEANRPSGSYQTLSLDLSVKVVQNYRNRNVLFCAE